MLVIETITGFLKIKKEEKVMKVQNMAIIFILIILPISLLLESYTRSKIQTINIQAQYDSKLMNATYDAIKAYQINSFNNPQDGLVNSKIRDIKASVNTFYNSIATNFSSLGYTQSALQNYVPAIVYTMYDGYYIYGRYNNVWDTETYKVHKDEESHSAADDEYGLKPYVYYSCRYQDSLNRDGNDVVITYSMDNYIQIQGKVNGNPVSIYGYLLGNSVARDASGNYTYKGYTIEENESLSETIFIKNKRYNK